MLLARLSKAVRTLHQDKDLGPVLSKAFGNPSQDFVELVSSKKLQPLLDKARTFRNKWKGHGGLASDQENERRLLQAEELLVDLRKVIESGFSRCKIISPGSNTYSKGEYRYNATELVGTRMPFTQVTVKTIHPMDTELLYLIHEGSNRPVELLPFIKFKQEQRACYFYSSIESTQVRYVSYHYDQQSELVEELGERIQEALNVLGSKEQ